ncbi:Argininosuccinate lyase [Candidatus Burkholderia brachyanthoides]|nr:Argininosuccinate lyase [Candidatus Burkholderia brachyanthoides]
MLCCTTVISSILGVLATLPNRGIKWAIQGYVELFRSIPLVVNVFFGASLLGLDLSPFVAATVGLSLWGGANSTVIVSGGLNAVPPHQWKSAMALGLRHWQVYAFTIGPQSLKSILPAFTGLLTLLVQSVHRHRRADRRRRVSQDRTNVIERATIMQGQSPAFRLSSVRADAARLLRHLLVAERLFTLSRTSPARVKFASKSHSNKTVRYFMSNSKVGARLTKAVSPEIYSGIFAPHLQSFGDIFDPLSDINKAHVILLKEQGLLSAEHAALLARGILKMEEASAGVVPLDPAREDAYFNYEAHLMNEVGADVGGRMHTGRSRNDIMATLERLRGRTVLIDVIDALLKVRATALEQAERYANVVTATPNCSPRGR